MQASARTPPTLVCRLSAQRPYSLPDRFGSYGCAALSGNATATSINILLLYIQCLAWQRSRLSYFQHGMYEAGQWTMSHAEHMQTRNMNKFT